MYGIFYINRQSKTVECISTYESFKMASRQFYAVISKYIDVEPSLRPATILKSHEFDNSIIKISPIMGYWIKIEDKSALIYRKQASNSWFSYSKIKEIGSFSILEIPEITNVNPIKTEKIKISSAPEISQHEQHGRHDTLIDELKLSLKNRTPKSIIVEKKEPKNDHNVFLDELKKRRDVILGSKIL